MPRRPIFIVGPILGIFVVLIIATLLPEGEDDPRELLVPDSGGITAEEFAESTGGVWVRNTECQVTQDAVFLTTDLRAIGRGHAQPTTVFMSLNSELGEELVAYAGPIVTRIGPGETYSVEVQGPLVDEAHTCRAFAVQEGDPDITRGDLALLKR